jgi:ATP-binding cassette subfamily B protein
MGRGGPAGQRTVDKPKYFGRSMRNLARYLSDYKWHLVATIIFAVASTIFVIVSPKLLGGMTNQIVDDYIAIRTYDQVMDKLPFGTELPAGTTVGDLMKNMSTGTNQLSEATAKLNDTQKEKISSLDLSQKPTMNFGILGKTALLLIGLYILSALFGYIQGFIITGVTQRISYRFRRDISEKINRLPLRYFDTRSYGDVLSRVTNDVDTISQSLSQSLSQIITALTMIIGILIMMLSINWQMTGIAVFVVIVSFVMVAIIVGHSQKHFKKQQDSLGAIQGHIEETYAGHSIVKAFGGEKRSIAQFSKINLELHESAWKSQFLSGLMYPIMNFVGNLGYVAVAVLGGWKAINGQISIGDIQAFIQYMQQFNQPIMQVSQVAGVVQSTAAAAERIFEFLGEKEESFEPANTIRIDKIDGNVEFDHVRFGYSSDKVVVKDFNAKIKAGQTVAIVGPTGAGKTTVVNLLMRFYDPESGTIRIDGVDTRTMTRADVRAKFAMVLQDTWLFSGTVRENLAYGNLDATDKQIKIAAQAAHVDHFIRSLPQDYDTVLDEDAENISGGEKQLITIARAMLTNAPMLILDEATSNVDTRTETLIQSAMKKLMANRTSFVIAHRLSTIRSADLILVMNEGNIIEQGTHKELLEQSGFYAKLYNAQFSEK